VDEDAPVPIEEVPPTELPNFTTSGVQPGDRGIIGVMADPATVAPLAPVFDIDPVNVTFEIIVDEWRDRQGPFTIHPITFATIQRGAHHNPWFNFETSIELIRTGLVAYFSGGRVPAIHVYLSRFIPLNRFYEGPRVPELHTGSERPDLSDEMLRAFQDSLPTFIALEDPDE
jgi:hypothetical protein